MHLYSKTPYSAIIYYLDHGIVKDVIGGFHFGISNAYGKQEG
jgi:hypothetical protein